MKVDRHHPGKAPTALLKHLSGNACLTIDQLVGELDLTRRQVSNSASILLRRGYLERMAIGCYQLTPAGVAAAVAGEVITAQKKGASRAVRRPKNSVRERAWRAMRVRRRFTVPDLVADAVIEGESDPTKNIWAYLRHLQKVGYVAELPSRAKGTALTSNGFKRWMIVRDTGPYAPVVLSKADGVHDFNTGEDVLCTPR